MKNPLSGSVNIPRIGKVPRAAVITVVGGAAIYIGWRWWAARGATSYDEETSTEEYEDAGTIPAVSGAYVSGLTDTDDEDTATGFTGTTNSAWSQYAIEYLTSSEQWSYTALASAIGAYLAHRALTSEQQRIVQAAIAVAGYPPTGTYTIIPGGDTTISVAPSGLTVKSKTATSVTLSWVAVSGATGYRVYRSGATENVGDSVDTTAVISGLEPGKKYTFRVAAYGISHEIGPKSSPVTATTSTVKVGKPSGLKITARTQTSVSLRWNKAANAEFYRIYVNGVARGTSEDTTHTVGALKKGTRYTIGVKADSTGGTTSAAATIRATTRK